MTGLYEAPEGALWVAACNGLFRAENGRFEVVIPASRLLFSFQGIVLDGRSHLLVATARGLEQVSLTRDAAGRFSVQPYPLPKQLRSRPVRGLSRQGSTLWFGCDQRLCSVDAGRLTTYGITDGLPEAP